MLEKDIEERLRIRVKDKEGIAYKFVSPGNTGVPDRIVLLPHKRIIFVELKSEEGKPTAGQLHQLRKIKSLGFQAVILGSIEDVDEFFTAYKNWEKFDAFIARQDEKYGI